MNNQISNPLMERFKKVAPNWANYIESQHKSLSKLTYPMEFRTWLKKWDMDSCALCIVGEAHGRSSDYLKTCKVCEEFCFDLANIHNPDWDRVLNYFLIHFETRHQ